MAIHNYSRIDAVWPWSALCIVVYVVWGNRLHRVHQAASQTHSGDYSETKAVEHLLIGWHGNRTCRQFHC
jgi:hypothetical protein